MESCFIPSGFDSSDLISISTGVDSEVVCVKCGITEEALKADFAASVESVDVTATGVNSLDDGNGDRSQEVSVICDFQLIALKNVYFVN